jgi:uncharacterized membrane protein
MFIRYGYGSAIGFSLWGTIIGLVLFALLVGSIVWLIVVISRPGRQARMHWTAGGYGPRFRSPAMDELDLAYARGQISREEYFRRRADLTGWGPPGGPSGFGGPGPGPQGPGETPGAPTSSQ